MAMAKIYIIFATIVVDVSKRQRLHAYYKAPNADWIPHPNTPAAISSEKVHPVTTNPQTKPTIG